MPRESRTPATFFGDSSVKNLPTTLLSAVRYFSDRDRCNEYMQSIKWPDGRVTCPTCGCESCSPVKGRPVLTCNNKDCRKQFSYKVGTIFEDSPLGLDKWFVAVWAIANCKNGISSHELARAIGVTQKTAWFMLHRIRTAMEVDGGDNLSGEVEADETFIGGVAANMHKRRREQVVTGRGAAHMTAVQGIMQRGGEVRTFVVPNVEGETLRGNVLRNVKRTATVNTDAAPAYSGLSRSYRHLSIDHAVEFVRGTCHTNSVENFWSLLKRSIKGTYTKVAPFHLHRYCHEQAYRFNQRLASDLGRFTALMARVLGRRLTYRQLCAIEDCGFMGKE